MGATLKQDRSPSLASVGELSGRLAPVGVARLARGRAILAGSRVGLVKIEPAVVPMAGYPPPAGARGDLVLLSEHPEYTDLAHAMGASADTITLVVDRPIDGPSVPATLPASNAGPRLLVFTPAGRIRLRAKLTVGCPLVAGPWRIFDLPQRRTPAQFQFQRWRPAGIRVLPQWWGADPGADPATNRAAIQAAIDSLIPGQTVFLSAGNYRVDGAITLARGVRLVGDGEGVTVLELGVPGPSVGVADAGTCLRTANIEVPSRRSPTGAVVERLSVVQSTGAAGTFGIRFGGPCNLVCRDVEVRGFATGIQILDPGGRDNPKTATPVDKTVLDRVTLVGQGRESGQGVDVSAGANMLVLRRLNVSDVAIGVGFNESGVIQPRTAISIVDCSFEGVKTGVRVSQGAIAGSTRQVAALRIEGCRFRDCSDHAADFGPDSLRENGAFVGDCQIEGGPGLGFGPAGEEAWRVHVTTGEGKAAAPPADADPWQAGDIVWNSTPGTGANRDVAGWVRVGPGPAGTKTGAP